MIAWTTTPWTLPSNVALCVHPDLDYVQIKGLQLCEAVKLAEHFLHLHGCWGIKKKLNEIETFAVNRTHKGN